MATGTFLQKSLLNHERLFFPMAEGGGIGPGPPLDVFISIKKKTKSRDHSGSARTAAPCRNRSGAAWGLKDSFGPFRPVQSIPRQNPTPSPSSSSKRRSERKGMIGWILKSTTALASLQFPPNRGFGAEPPIYSVKGRTFKMTAHRLAPASCSPCDRLLFCSPRGPMFR
jgi:hypothetical protein